MGERQQQLVVQALGRPSYLGQLYNATTSTLFSGFNLFHRQDVTSASVEASVSSTTVDFKEVRSLMDRARSLDISASLSVSILGGGIELSGMGLYLDSKIENNESITVASLVRIRTVNSTLDVNRLRSMQAMTREELLTTRATHVVTSITYGGNIIGTATQVSDMGSSKNNVEGKFTLDVFKGMGKLFGASGEANVDAHERERLEGYNLHVRLDGDFQPPKDEQLPTTAVELLQTMKKSVSFIQGNGVPCELILTPLDWFHSDIPTFRELNDADLRSLANLYDRIISLDKNRGWLTWCIEEQRYLFPSFLEVCRKSGNRVADLVSRARQELRSFLERYRGRVDGTPSPAVFQREITSRFTQEMSTFEADREKWLLMKEWIRAGKYHGFPLVPVSEVRIHMNRPDKESVALVLVPESVQFATLLQTYRILAGDIRKWQSTLSSNVSTGANTGQTQFLSVYADPQLDEQLRTLDDNTSSIGRALETARKNSDVAFLTYGVSSDGLVQLQWSVLNQEGWGVLVSREEGWRYIGNVKKGLRHGSGIITYADGSIYSGDWIQGKRDGLGKLFSSEAAANQGKPSAEGVYVDNLLARDGVVLKVTVYRNCAPVQFGRVALRSADSTMAHVSKIARVLGWRLGKKFRVKLESTVNAFHSVSVLVNGSRVDPSEDPDVALSLWPLDTAGEKLIIVEAL